MGDDAMSSEREFNEGNIEEFRRNGGKVGGQFEGFPLLLLTSTGARSGAQRVNPVAYFNVGGKIYIVGSAAGRDKNTAWVHNVRANPRVTVEIGSEAPKPATACELPRDERDSVFRVVVERAPGFGEYQESTDRLIPVFELITPTKDTSRDRSPHAR
jgi:deazaflavin-dependent oxidoreductase (nitroreductase family)